MTINEIFAHISLRIKPIVGASINERKSQSDIKRKRTPHKRFKLVNGRKAFRLQIL